MFRTSGAVVRYTLDGSRPTQDSPVIPAKGIDFMARATVQINLRAFKSGMIPSITNGALLELNYVLGREASDSTERTGCGNKIFWNRCL